MELTAPEKTGLIVTSITGLGPVKAEIKCTSIATSDGSIFNSARLGERNIVLKLQFLPNPTIEETRLLTYKYFPIRKKVKLLIETDKRIAEIEGYVETNEPSIPQVRKETTSPFSMALTTTLNFLSPTNPVQNP